jgi:uncharacterized protein YcbK (DUF882 family)
MNSKLNKIKISSHFYLAEFQSPDTKTVMLEPELIQKLENLRFILDVPIIISSGYRTLEHNKFVGGKLDSRHMSGRAADVYVPNVKEIDFELAVKRVLFHYMYKIKDSGCYHLDIGD